MYFYVVNCSELNASTDTFLQHVTSNITLSDSNENHTPQGMMVALYVAHKTHVESRSSPAELFTGIRCDDCNELVCLLQVCYILEVLWPLLLWFVHWFSL